MMSVPLLHAVAELPSTVGLEDGGDCSRYQSGAVCALERFGESKHGLTHGVRFGAECQVVGLSGIWSPGKVHYKKYIINYKRCGFAALTLS